MINIQAKQEIVDAMKALNYQDDALRHEAVIRLGKTGISHPKIIEQLQEIVKNDSNKDIRIAAQKSLESLQNVINNTTQSISSQYERGVSVSETESAILELLRQQSNTLESIRFLVLNSLAKEKGSEKTYYVRSNIVDVDMSISSMTNLIFNWLIASIPVVIIVAIVVAIIFALLSSCTY
jgi:hypothetical protein